MSNFVICGKYNDGNGFLDIVADYFTGEAVLMSDLLGNCYLSEITVPEPVPFNDETIARSLCEQLDCDGVILSDTYLISLKENKAYFRKRSDALNVLYVVEYNTFLEATDVHVEE